MSPSFQKVQANNSSGKEWRFLVSISFIAFLTYTLWQSSSFAIFGQTSSISLIENATSETSDSNFFNFSTNSTRITKVTIFYGTGMLYEGPENISERVLQTHQRHADLQGHRQVIQRTNLMQSIWTKPATILDVILEELQKPKGQGAEWILWHDADTVIMNPLIHLETYLPPAHLHEKIHLLVTHDQAGLNNGIFFIKVSTWAVELLSSIIAFPKVQQGVQYGHEDQGVMAHLISKVSYFQERTRIVPRHWLNPYPQYNDADGNPEVTMFHPGYLLVHAVAWSKKSLPGFVEKAEQHLSDYEKLPKDTGLKAEVDSYWKGTWKGGNF